MKIHLRGDSSWLRMCDTLCVDIKKFDDKIDVFVAIFLEMIHVLNSMCLRLWQVAQVLHVDFFFFSDCMSHATQKRLVCFIMTDIILQSG